jgi:hypothetical protein
MSLQPQTGQAIPEETARVACHPPDDSVPGQFRPNVPVAWLVAGTTGRKQIVVYF